VISRRSLLALAGGAVAAAFVPVVKLLPKAKKPMPPMYVPWRHYTCVYELTVLGALVEADKIQGPKQKVPRVLGMEILDCGDDSFFMLDDNRFRGLKFKVDPTLLDYA
jgi:hypothetical protein